MVPAHPRLVGGQEPPLRAGSAAQAPEPQLGRIILPTQQCDQDHHPDLLRSHPDPLSTDGGSGLKKPYPPRP